MARLNDLLASTESIEALKRRFVRQNREIARANSIQSLRIQSLESEVSHLLRENAVLREQVISLSQDVERFEAAKSLSNEICTYKDKLASKLTELGDLVDELGTLPQKFGRANELQQGSFRSERQQSSVVPPRRTEVGPDGSEEDGRLPVILEDKYFPRRTLESQELHDISNANSDLFDSPKIGPPPIAHLDADQSLSPELLTENLNFIRSDSGDQVERDPPSQSSLETKSSTKDNTFLRELSQPKLARGASNSEVTNLVKSGSKRKFSARDDDDRLLSNIDIIDDDFQYSRALNISQREPSQTGTQNPEEPFDCNQDSLGKQLRNARTSKRKVLEPKSTNMRSMSPRKQCTADSKSQEEHIRRDNREENTRKESPILMSQQLDTDSKPDSKSCPNKGRRTVSAETPNAPQTGSLECLKDLSPRVEPNHSPRPGTWESARIVQSTTGPASRSTRRPRSTISYVEPNLRDKMRRPTNELVDAVVADRFRRMSSSQVEKSNRDGDQDIHISKAKTKTKMASTIKGNDGVFLPLSNSDDSTNETAAPSEDVKFHGLSELPTTVITERKRRTLSANKDDLTRSQDSSNLSTSPAYTIMPGGRKAPDRRRGGVCQVDYINDSSKTVQAVAESQSIPDINNETEVIRAPRSTHISPVGTVRHVRRHSSSIDSAYREKRLGKDQTDHHQAQDESWEPSGILSGYTQSSGAIHQMNKGIINPPDRKEQSEMVRFSEIEEQAKINSERSINTATDRGQIKRSQRAAARRRSMML